MDTSLKKSIWQQYGAALDMLANAINSCPDQLWAAIVLPDSDDPRYGQFWQITFHTLLWVDLYLTGTSEGFMPPTPFLRSGLPNNPYPKDEVLTYLKQCRQKCQGVIESMTDEQANQICTFEWVEVSFMELQLYAMRHVQEHAAQLSLFLAQNGGSDLDWVTVAKSDPS